MLKSISINTPKIYNIAINDKEDVNWKITMMNDEDASLENDTWILVSRLHTSYKLDFKKSFIQ